MLDEARRIKMLDQHYTDDGNTQFSFEDFIKIFSNHYYITTEAEIEDAFRYLGLEENLNTFNFDDEKFYEKPQALSFR